MTPSVAAPDVRDFLVAYLSDLGQRLGVAQLPLSDQTQLFNTGVVDSVGFIELVLATEERFGISLDLDRHDPAEFTTLGGLIRAVVASGTAT